MFGQVQEEQKADIRELFGSFAALDVSTAAAATGALKLSRPRPRPRSRFQRRTNRAASSTHADGRRRVPQLCLQVEDSLSAAAACALRASQLAAIRRNVLQDSSDLLWLILHHVHDARTLLRAARVCAAWRSASYDDDVWRARCLGQWSLTAQVMSRADVHTPSRYRELSTRLALADHRLNAAFTPRQLAFMPPPLCPPAPVQRADYMIGVEVGIQRADGSPAVHHWSRLCELQHVCLCHDELMVADHVIGAAPVSTSDIASSVLSVFLLRKKDNRIIALCEREEPLDHDYCYRLFEFSLRNTGVSSDVGKVVHFEAYVNHNLDCGGVDLGVITGVKICLDTDEGGWMDEEPVSTVDSLLQLLEAPAFADRWVPPVLTRSGVLGALGALGADVISAKSTKPPTTISANTFWQQIEKTTTLLNRILGYLAAKDLCLAGEVNRSWYTAAQSDVTWQRICLHSTFSLLSTMHKNHSWSTGMAWKGLYVQRILANKAATTASADPLLPDSGCNEYLIGLQVTNGAEGKRTPLLSILTDLSDNRSAIRELASVPEVRASAWVPTADFSPQLRVSLIRKRDGKILILGQGVESEPDGSDDHVVQMCWRLPQITVADVPFPTPFFEATVFCSLETQHKELRRVFSTPRRKTHRKVCGLTVTGVSLALADMSELDEWNWMENRNQLLHALESPTFEQRWV